MEVDFQRSLSLRPSRRIDRNNQSQETKGKQLVIGMDVVSFFVSFQELGLNFLCCKWCCFYGCMTYVNFVVHADVEYGIFSMETIPQDVPMRILWKKGFIRLILVGSILWMFLILVVLLFQVWSCQSSIAFISGITEKVLAGYHVIYFDDH